MSCILIGLVHLTDIELPKVAICFVTLAAVPIAMSVSEAAGNYITG